MVASHGVDAFATDNSRGAEASFQEAVLNSIQMRANLGLKLRISIEELTGKKATLARGIRGNPAGYIPDTGYVTKNGKIVGIPSVKYQKSKMNGCQRVLLEVTHAYMLNIPMSCVLLIFFGEGFEVLEDGCMPGSTGPLVEMCQAIGARVLINPSDAELAFEVDEWLTEIDS